MKQNTQEKTVTEATVKKKDSKLRPAGEDPILKKALPWHSLKEKKEGV